MLVFYTKIFRYGTGKGTVPVGTSQQLCRYDIYINIIQACKMKIVEFCFLTFPDSVTIKSD
jgi:hypothetical protein